MTDEEKVERMAVDIKRRLTEGLAESLPNKRFAIEVNVYLTDMSEYS